MNLTFEEIDFDEFGRAILRKPIPTSESIYFDELKELEKDTY